MRPKIWLKKNAIFSEVDAKTKYLLDDTILELFIIFDL